MLDALSPHPGLTVDCTQVVTALCSTPVPDDVGRALSHPGLTVDTHSGCYCLLPQPQCLLMMLDALSPHPGLTVDTLRLLLPSPAQPQCHDDVGPRSLLTLD